ncbi:iron ABC transporter permease [Leucobacter sp. OH2974_COT-288]|nr:iron ABC transporter permease [Leucobacter sp. OH2974_COT-288]
MRAAATVSSQKQGFVGGLTVGKTLFWCGAALLPALVIGVFFLYPVLTLFARGFSDLSGFVAALEKGRTLQVVGQTLLQAGSATALAVVLGVPAAYVLYCLKFPGVGVLKAVLSVPFVLPTVVVALSFNALYGPGGPLYFLGLDGSFAVVVFALTFFNISVISRTVGVVWAKLDPRVVYAAYTLGASPLRAFCTLTLRQLMPAIGSAASLVFLYCATSFGIVLILGGRKYANLEAEIYENAVRYIDLETATALSLVQIVIVIAALFAANSLRRRGETLQLAEPARKTLRTPGAKLLLVYVLVTFGVLQLAPLAALVLRSLTVKGAFSLHNYASLTQPQRSFNGSALDAALLSLQSAVGAAALTLALAVPAALVASRKPRNRMLRTAVGLFDGFLMLPVGISAVTLGFGLLITMHAPFGLGVDLRSSGILIPIAQALVAQPLVLRALIPVLRGIPEADREAARMLGAGPLRVLATIDLPLLRRPLAVVLGFAFAVSLGEFGATSFLVRPGITTLPVMIGQIASRPGHEAYGVATAAAVLLAVICAGVMLLSEKLLTTQRHKQLLRPGKTPAKPQQTARRAQ